MDNMICGNRNRTSPAPFRMPVLLLALCLLFLAGCGQGASLPAGRKSEKGYSLPEIMVIAMTEQNRYEEICTDQIWNVEIAEEGENFASYLTGQIKNFMEELKIMNLLAQDRNMSLRRKSVQRWRRQRRNTLEILPRKISSIWVSVRRT